MSTKATKTTTMKPSLSSDDDKKDSTNGNKETTTTIKEGSANMTFPSNQESTVFYNPVQVQNRDLSILMITLYGEQRAIKNAVKLKRKQIIEQQQKEATEETTAGVGDNNSSNKKLSKEERKKKHQQIQDEVKIYEDELMSKFEKNQLPDDFITEEKSKSNGLTVLEALAASGLRSVRYWKEIPGIKHITINDLEYEAIERAKNNLRSNGLYGNNNSSNSNDNYYGDDDDNDDDGSVVLNDNTNRDYGIYPQIGDATHVMYMSRRSQFLRTVPEYAKTQQLMWDVIDLDPYGSAAPFVDGAVQAVENGGLLCITCTDMAALGGSHPETAFGRYAGLPIQSAKYLQELALRILLYTVSVSAARYGRTIKPLLCVGMDFYVRCFLQVNNDKRGVMDLSLNIGHVYQSTNCSTFQTLPHGQLGGKKGNVYQSIRLNPSTCPETGATFKVGGPIWLGPLHDPTTVKAALKRVSNPKCQSPDMEFIATRKRLQGLLTTVSEEIDTPLYYNLSALSKDLHTSSPPVDTFKAGLYNSGYRVSGYHKEPMAIKTDAPSSVVWDVLRAWLKTNPPHKPPPEGSVAEKILSKEPSIEVDFTIPKSFQNKGPKVSRFPMNPERHWGPKRKASNVVPSASDDKMNDGGGGGGEDKDEVPEEPPKKRMATEEGEKES